MIGIVRSLGSVIKLVAGPALKLVNKLPAGTMTGTGGVVGAVGIATGLISPHVVTDANIVAIINAAAGVLTALGTVIASFGAQRAHAAPSA